MHCRDFVVACTYERDAFTMLSDCFCFFNAFPNGKYYPSLAFCANSLILVWISCIWSRLKHQIQFQCFFLAWNTIFLNKFPLCSSYDFDLFRRMCFVFIQLLCCTCHLHAFHYNFKRSVRMCLMRQFVKHGR